MVALPVDRLGSRFNGFIVLTWLRWCFSGEFLMIRARMPFG